MLSISSAARDFLLGSRMPFCSMWWIRLETGKRYFWTDHDVAIWYPYEGAPGAHRFVPEGALTRSNVRKQSGGRPHSTELAGVISSESGLVKSELDVKLWDFARVFEFVINWEYPHAEPVYQAVYRVGNVEHTDEEYSFDALGVSALMDKVSGRKIGPKCHWTLGQAYGAATNVHGCRADVDSKRIDRVEVESIDAENRTIVAVAATLPSTSDGHYDIGYVDWITGENAGLPLQEVKSYVDAGRVVEMTLRQPFPVQAGDLFNLRPGCDHTKTGCTFWEQFPSKFGGESFAPTESELRSPPHRGEQSS